MKTMNDEYVFTSSRSAPISEDLRNYSPYSRPKDVYEFSWLSSM